MSRWALLPKSELRNLFNEKAIYFLSEKFKVKSDKLKTKWGCGAGVRGTDAHVVGHSGRHDIHRDGRLHFFCFQTIAEKDERKLKITVTNKARLGHVFVDKRPARVYLYENVARALRVVGIADAADARCPGTLCESGRGIDITNTAVLEEEILAGLEHLRKVQLLLFDEFVVQILESYSDKQFRSVNDDDLGFEPENGSTEKEEDDEALFGFIKETLGDKVSSVKLSRKLVSHPVCISTEGPVSLEMEKYFSSIPGGEGPKVKAERVLELNGGHPVFAALKEAYNTDKEKAAGYAKILYDMALLIAGIPVEDPTALSQEVWKLF